MSESITNRVSRIIAGSLHSLVDSVENLAPEAVMEQAVREVDDAIRDVRADLGTIEARRHLTTKRLAEESQRHEDLTDQARLALDQGREDLASAALERQMDIEAQIPVLESSLSELAEEKNKLEGFINALQAKKREMNDELMAYRKTTEVQNSPTGTATGRKGESVESRADRAGDAFDRIYSRKTGLKGTSGVSAQNAAQLAELEEMTRKNRIEERLQQLKASKRT